MIDERKRKLQLIEAEKEKKAAALRLTEAQEKIDALSGPKHSPRAVEPGVNVLTRCVVATDFTGMLGRHIKKKCLWLLFESRLHWTFIINLIVCRFPLILKTCLN